MVAPSSGAVPSGRSAIDPPIPLSNRLLAKPFIDQLCLWGFRWLLPASHAWAVAAQADGDVDFFSKAFALRRISSRLRARLQRTAALKQVADAAFETWRLAAFDGAAASPEGQMAMLELARRRAAQAFAGQRLAYTPFAKWQGLPAVAYAIPHPDSALPNLRDEAATIERLFAVPRSMPAVEISRRSVVHGVAEYWLRFASPAGADATKAGGDQCWVHVYEPLDTSSHMPSLIWAHGLSMELEMMEAGPLDFLSLARAGIRVLMPDGPGHNRRAQPGLYGGESFLQAAPVSGLQHFSQAAGEYAVLIDWCRAQGSTRVALGGISLGALSAQVAAGHMSTWPDACRPDALLLLTTTDQVSALATESTLGQVADVDQAVLAAGWRAAHLAALAPLTDAAAQAPVDPARIVMLLGRRDNVTPYAGGRRLADQWRLPAENVFIRDQGHFSAAFGLAIDPAPYRRILEILKG
jgi:pimeloyl-ACP methyl ester carboxylesterase